MTGDFIVSQEPLVIDPAINYELRAVKCARCASVMPHAPFPTNSDMIRHRPRCGECGSSWTYPIDPSTVREMTFDELGHRFRSSEPTQVVTDAKITFLIKLLRYNSRMYQDRIPVELFERVLAEMTDFKQREIVATLLGLEVK